MKHSKEKDEVLRWVAADMNKWLGCVACPVNEEVCPHKLKILGHPADCTETILVYLQGLAEKGEG